MHLKLKVSLRFLPFVLGPVFTHFNPAKSALKVCFDAHCYTNSLLHNWILSYSHLLLFRFTHCCFAFATKRSFAAVTTRQAVRTFVIFLSSYPTWILEVTTRSPVMKLRASVGLIALHILWTWNYFLPYRCQRFSSMNWKYNSLSREIEKHLHSATT